MPLATDPNRTVEFSLDVDSELPIDQRPMFKTHFLTGRDTDEIRERLHHADTVKDEANAAIQAALAANTPVGRDAEKEYRTELLKACAIWFAGVRNLKDKKGKPVTEALELDRALVNAELKRVCWRAIQESRLSEWEEKKSEPQSVSSGEPLAASAKPVDASSTATPATADAQPIQ